MSNERIDLTWLEGKTATREERIENICGDYDYVENLLSELKRCYELLDGMEVERYPEPDELTPSNTSRAGADWPSGPRM